MEFINNLIANPENYKFSRTHVTNIRRGNKFPLKVLFKQKFTELSETSLSKYLSHVQDYINFEHEDLKKYIKNSKIDKVHKDTLLSWHYSEKLAITFYTSKKYKHINSLLRNGVVHEDDSNPKLTVMTIAVMMSAMSKIPEYDYPEVYRFDRCIKLEKEFKAYQFFSTSCSPTGYGEGQEGERTIIYQTRGINITPLSLYESEEEYLIPFGELIKVR